MNEPHRRNLSPLPATRRCRTASPLRTAALVAGACFFSPAFAMAEGIEPGEWQLTETITVNGQAMPAQMRSRFLTPEEASNTVKTFTPEYRTVNSNCEQIELKSTPTSLTWHMQCTGPMDMDVSGEFAFDTARHYTARIVSKGFVAGRQVVDSRVSIEAEHVDESR